MLRRLACIVCICLLLMTCACTPAVSPEGNTLLATFYPIYVAALNITRDVPGVTVQCMASPQSGCLHDYQLTSADRLKIENAWLIAATGLDMESFLDDILHQKTVLDLSADYVYFIRFSLLYTNIYRFCIKNPLQKYKYTEPFNNKEQRREANGFFTF